MRNEGLKPIEMSAIDPRFIPRAYSPARTVHELNMSKPTPLGEHLAIQRTPSGRPMFLGDQALHGALAADAMILRDDFMGWVGPDTAREVSVD